MGPGSSLPPPAPLLLSVHPPFSPQVSALNLLSLDHTTTHYPLLLLRFSHQVVSDSVTPWTVACQSPLPMGFLRREYWSGLPFPSPCSSILIDFLHSTKILVSACLSLETSRASEAQTGLNAQLRNQSP